MKIISALSVAALLAAGIAGADATRVQTAEEALHADARWYARDQNVSQEEAVRRLRIQMEMGGLIGRLRKTHKARLAGIALEHQPVYRVRVLLTGTKPVPSEQHSLGGSTLPVVFETGARATLEKLVAAMTVHQAALKRLYPTMSGMGTDERTGEIVVYVYAPTAADAAAAKAKLPEAQTLLGGLPVRIEVTDGYPTLL